MSKRFPGAWLFVLSGLLSAQSGDPAGGTAVSGGPEITANVITLTGRSTVNLSSYADWRMWGAPALDCTSGPCSRAAKAGGKAISGLYSTGPGDPRFYPYNDSFTTFSYSDADGERQAETLTNSIYSNEGGTVYFTAPADKSPQTLNIWITELSAVNVSVTFHMSDGSVSDTTVNTPVTTGSDGRGHLLYAVRYAASGNGKFLTVTFNSNTTDTQFHAAALSRPLITPSTYTLALGQSLQDAVDFTQEADTILLPDGYNYTGLLTAPVNKAVSIRTSLSLGAGQRILPSEPRASLTLPNGSNGAVVFIPTGARNFSLDGVEIKGNNYEDYGLVVISPTAYFPKQRISDLPHDIKITHCYIHGHPMRLAPDGNSAAFTGNYNVGIQADGYNVLIQDNVITDFVYDGKESNAINIRIGKNVTIDNNELDSNGENILMYAAGAYSNENPPPPGYEGLQPDTVTISHNYIHKNLAYQFVRFTKNLIEQKNGINSRIYNNLAEYSFEGLYSQGQHGPGFVIANRTAHGLGGDDSAATPWASTRNIEIDHNIIRHVGIGFAIQGIYDDYWACPGGNPDACDYAGEVRYAMAAGVPRASNWNIHDNYVDDIDGGRWATITYSQRYGPGNTNAGTGLKGPGADNFTFRNNTLIFAHGIGDVDPAGSAFGVPYPAHTISATDYHGYDSTSTRNLVFAGSPALNHTFDNNIFPWEFSATGDGTNGYSTLDPDNTIFTNNNISFVFTDWPISVFSANSAYPGKWTGNTISASPSATQGVGPGTASLLAMEAGIRSGNR